MNEVEKAVYETYIDAMDDWRQAEFLYGKASGVTTTYLARLERLKVDAKRYGIELPSRG